MTTLRLVLAALSAALIVSAQPGFSQESSPAPGGAPPASCPVTLRPANEFKPPAGYKRGEKEFWLGTENLWTVLSDRGIWQDHFYPPHPGRPLPQIEIPWMSTNQDWQLKAHPDLKVKGKRLDGPSSPMLATPPFRPNSDPSATMTTNLYIPLPGLLGDHRRVQGQQPDLCCLG
jgi:hypothetical protein